MHVVHLEDDDPLREILRVALQAANAKVDIHQFEDSDSAWSYIHEHFSTIQLYILDIRVPGELDGIQLAQKIRDLHPQGNIVLTSAYTSPPYSLLKSLQCDWFPKPWHIMEITQKLFQIARQSP